MKNREIKFRAWNGSNMELNVMVGFLGAFYVQGIDEKDSASMSPFNTKYFHETPVMQFTGCKDCNGKEIYEGDIVECKDGTIGEVAFSQQAGCWWIKWKAKVNHYKELTDSAQTGDGTDLILEGNEVVGNVYENPIFKANW